ncbi:MAG TPA: hypothetical protein VF081_09250 [Solirubrobacterales bacterium]
MTDNQDKPEPGGELARAGARIGGAAAGGFLSAVMGPEAGAGAGQALSELGESLVTYVLDQRPRDRVLRVLGRAAGQVEERRAAGEEVRPEIADTESEEAAAVFEAVVDAAARSFEEKKGEAIANFYASVAFDSSVSIPDALLYLRRIRSASWRQLVAMRFFESEERKEERELIQVPLTEGDAYIHPPLGDELSELFRALGLLGVDDGKGHVNNPSDIWDGGDAVTKTSNVRLTSLGAAVIRLSRLDEIVTAEELDEIAAELHRETIRPRG